jgi:hypothetical protein
MNTLHIPTPRPGNDIQKPPAGNPNVDGNPGDDLSLPGDKPVGEESQVLDDEGPAKVDGDDNDDEPATGGSGDDAAMDDGDEKSA